MTRNETSMDMTKRQETFARTILDTKKSFKDVMAIVNRFSSKDCRMYLLDTDDSFARLRHERFHLAVVDGSVFSKCFYLITHRLGIPWITYTDFPEPWLIRLPWLPSFVPLQFSTYTERMTFSERTCNNNTLLNVYM